MRHSLKIIVLALLLGGLLLAVPIALAQESAPAADSAAAPGISTLVFLLGAGAIIIVGGVSMARDSYSKGSDEK